MDNNLHREKFVIDSIPGIHFEGYSAGDTWNGWACPYFEKAEAERVLKASEKNGYEWTYDPEADVYLVTCNDDPSEYEPERFSSTRRNAEDGKEIVVYGIGAYSWIWEKASLEKNV